MPRKFPLVRIFALLVLVVSGSPTRAATSLAAEEVMKLIGDFKNEKLSAFVRLQRLQSTLLKAQALPSEEDATKDAALDVYASVIGKDPVERDIYFYTALTGATTMGPRSLRLLPNLVALWKKETNPDIQALIGERILEMFESTGVTSAMVDEAMGKLSPEDQKKIKEFKAAHAEDLKTYVALTTKTAESVFRPLYLERPPQKFLSHGGSA